MYRFNNQQKKKKEEFRIITTICHCCSRSRSNALFFEQIFSNNQEINKKDWKMWSTSLAIVVIVFLISVNCTKRSVWSGLLKDGWREIMLLNSVSKEQKTHLNPQDWRKVTKIKLSLDSGFPEERSLFLDLGKFSTTVVQCQEVIQ